MIHNSKCSVCAYGYFFNLSMILNINKSSKQRFWNGNRVLLKSLHIFMCKSKFLYYEIKLYPGLLDFLLKSLHCSLLYKNKIKNWFLQLFLFQLNIIREYIYLGEWELIKKNIQNLAL